MPSRALGHEVRWDARTEPFDARRQRRDRALLVLLHGAGIDRSQWTAIGLDHARTAAAQQRNGAAPVVLTPDLPAHPSDRAEERFLAAELLTLARRCFGATDDPAKRAVGGISIGGRIALEVAARRPDLFRAVGGHSPAVHTTDAERLAAALANDHAAVQLDTGDGDGFRPGTEALAAALRRRGVAVSLRIAPGGHDRRYWRRQLPGSWT